MKIATNEVLCIVQIVVVKNHLHVKCAMDRDSKDVLCAMGQDIVENVDLVMVQDMMADGNAVAVRELDMMADGNVGIVMVQAIPLDGLATDVMVVDMMHASFVVEMEKMNVIGATEQGVKTAIVVQEEV